MKKFLKRFPFIYKFIKKIYSCFMRLKNLILYFCLSKNKNINNTDVIIMGTGPSLKKDLKKILFRRDACSLMAVNSFCIDNSFESLKPDYYFLADPAYYVKEAAGVGVKDTEIFIENIEKKLIWNMVLILPVIAKESVFVKRLEKNQFIKIEYVNLNSNFIPFFVSKYKLYDKNVVAPIVQNVLHMCLYYSIYKRFKNIYIFGADHNWCKDITVTNDNVVSIEENHFYENEHHKTHPMEKEDGSHWTMGELFDAWTKVYNGYYDLKKYADFAGIKIYNESSISFIDAFERNSGHFDD